jgi:hypothetical protein
MKKGFLILCSFILCGSFIACQGDNDKPSVFKLGVSGKIVNVANFPLRSASITITDKSGKRPVETTQVSGEYLLLLDTGLYTLDVKAKGYEVSSAVVKLVEKDTLLDFILLGKASLVGKVIDAQTGNGILGAKISFVRDTASSPVRGEYQVEFATETDTEGEYDLSSLPIGKFIGIVEKAGYTLKKTEVIELKEGANSAPTVSL